MKYYSPYIPLYVTKPIKDMNIKEFHKILREYPCTLSDMKSYLKLSNFPIKLLITEVIKTRKNTIYNMNYIINIFNEIKYRIDNNIQN